MKDSNYSAQRKALASEGLPAASCCASSTSRRRDSDHPLLDRDKWWKAEKWSSDLCELEFLHLLEWCDGAKSTTGKTSSSPEEVEAMLSLWRSWNRPHPSNVRDEYLVSDDLDIQKLEFGNWSLRVWESFISAQRLALARATQHSDSQTTASGALPEASCCASSEVLKLREARAKFESKPITRESVAEYLIAAAQSLQSFALAFPQDLSISPGQTIGEFLDQLQPCTDG